MGDARNPSFTGETGMSILSKIKAAGAAIGKKLTVAVHTAWAAAVAAWAAFPADLKGMLSPKVIGIAGGALVALGFLAKWLDGKNEAKAVNQALYTPVPGSGPAASVTVPPTQQQAP
jgi:hypothetical protein